MRVSEIITKQEVETWDLGEIISIDAGTGSGKSYFIKTVLYEKAKEENKKILVMVNRTLLEEQWIADTEEQRDTISVKTFQKHSYMKLHEYSIDWSEYDYIVWDEAQAIVVEASYNSTSDLALDLFLNATTKTRILLSATGESTIKYLEEYRQVELRKYFIPRDGITKNISSLYFYNDDNTMIKFIQDKIASKKNDEIKERIIYFCESATKAYSLYRQFEKYSTFNCSKSNKLYDYVNKNDIEQIIYESKFDKQILFCTKSLDNGVNIIDETVKTIIADVEDIDSLRQCLGRKRSQSIDDTISVFIKNFKNNSIGGRITQNKKKISMANFLKEHTVKEFIETYPRELDYSKIIYDVVSNDENLAGKKVNEVMLYKTYEDNKIFQKIIQMGKNGYKYYIRDVLQMEYYIDIEEDKNKSVLENYLNTIVGQIMLQLTDRKELIEKIDLRRDGKLLKSLNSINSALVEQNIPFFIKEFETSRIEDGKKKKYKNAWKVLRLTEN